MSSNRAWVQVKFVLSVLPVSMRKCSLPSQPPSSARLQCACDWPCPLSGLLSPELHCFLPPSLWSVTGNRGAVGDSFFTFLCSVLWAAGIDSHCLLSLYLKWSYPELDYSFCCGSYDSFIYCLSNDFLFIHLYSFRTFVCLNVYLPVCVGITCMPVTFGGQKREWGLWNWSYRLLWATMLVLETKPGCLQEQPVILSAASSLQPLETEGCLEHSHNDPLSFACGWFHSAVTKYIWGKQQTAAAATA